VPPAWITLGAAVNSDNITAADTFVAALSKARKATIIVLAKALAADFDFMLSTPLWQILAPAARTTLSIQSVNRCFLDEMVPSGEGQ
jgi:hypothetical protein